MTRTYNYISFQNTPRPNMYAQASSDLDVWTFCPNCPYLDWKPPSLKAYSKLCFFLAKSDGTRKFKKCFCCLKGGLKCVNRLILVQHSWNGCLHVYEHPVPRCLHITLNKSYTINQFEWHYREWKGGMAGNYWSCLYCAMAFDGGTVTTSTVALHTPTRCRCLLKHNKAFQGLFCSKYY